MRELPYETKCLLGELHYQEWFMNTLIPLTTFLRLVAYVARLWEQLKKCIHNTGRAL